MPSGPFGNKLKFILISKDDYVNQELKLGTYGFIKGARYFIVGLSKPGEHVLVDFGFLFEKIILELTELGFGTCWLGGTFTRKEFNKTVNAEKDEIIAAISPVGYPTEKRTPNDRLIRMGAGSKTRKPNNKLFFTEEFKKALDLDKCEKFKPALEMLRLAPSASNRQPWRIIKENNSDIFHFYLERDKNYQKINKKVDLQMIDMGIAISHFDLVASESNLSGRWNVLDLNNINSSEYICSWIGNET